MFRLLARAAVLAVLTLNLLGTTDADGSVANYNGTLCKDYINYQVWVPPGASISTIEADLIQKGLTDQTLKLISSSCFNSFMEYICTSSFPKVTPNNSSNLLFACKSTCQKVVAQCSQAFTTTGKQNLIPDCDGPINGTDGTLFQPDGSCNVATPLSSYQASNQTSYQTSIACPLPFIPDTMQGPNGTSTNPSVCSSGCCLPCPAQYSLYPEGILEKGYKIIDGFRMASTVLSFILVLSYMFLPDKRVHPSSLVFFYSICVFLFSVVVVFALADRRGIQCVDAINFSTQQNNPTCAVQGAILLFASVACCSWCSAIILNLHLHAVWNNAWFARNVCLTHFLCWGYPIAVTAAIVGMGEVRWETGSYCLISQEKSSTMFFYPLAAIIFPSFLIHTWTFIHIARVSIKYGSNPSSASRSTLTGSETPSISHRRHVMMIIKLQWRAALMAILATISVMTYWLFYFIQIKKTKPEILRPNIQNHFVGCLILGGNQDSCAVQLAPYLPPFGLIMMAESIVACVGIIVFIIFFRPTLIVEWRELFERLRFFLSRSGRNKEEHEFVEI